jgi:hypothetical protein
LRWRRTIRTIAGAKAGRAGAFESAGWLGGIGSFGMPTIVDWGANATVRTPPSLRRLAMRGPQRRVVLRGIFRLMARQLDPTKAAGIDGVVLWEITSRHGRRTDRWQLVIADGRARTSRRIDRAPTVTIGLEGGDFLELVTGVANGPALFLQGRLRLDGDLALGSRLPSLFRLPRPQVRRDPRGAPA